MEGLHYLRKVECRGTRHRRKTAEARISVRRGRFGVEGQAPMFTRRGGVQDGLYSAKSWI